MNPVSGIAAYIGRRGGNALSKMLTHMERRAAFGFTIYSARQDTCVCAEQEGIQEAIAGACLRFKGKVPQMPLHGEIYEPEWFDLDYLHRHLSGGCFKEAAELMKCVDGAYSIIWVGEDEMVLIRDHLGQKPLYYAQNSDFIAAASEKIAVEALGLKAEEAPKASLLYLSYNERQVYPFEVEQSEPLVDDLNEAAGYVLTLLKRSLRARLRKSGSVALGFSGGIDSALLAKLASCEKDVKLLCLGMVGSRGLSWGAEAAKSLGLDLEIYPLSVEAVEEARSRLCMNSIFNASDLCIGVCVELLARRAREVGCETLILGQLADELFGGYMRYQNAYKLKGLEASHKLMVEDVLSAERGLKRDEYASAPYVDLCLPYASRPLVEYALKIHPELKVDASRRKIVLRKAAEALNLPKEIVEAPKKALQYSTGIQKAFKSASRKPYNVTL